MSELRDIIQKEAQSRAEEYIRWQYEGIAPYDSPKETVSFDWYQKEIDNLVKGYLIPNATEGVSVKSKDGSTISLKDVDLGLELKKEKAMSTVNFTPINPPSDVDTIKSKEQALKAQKAKSRAKIRSDFQGYSKIKIDRIDGVNDYTDIVLLNGDRYQRLYDPEKWGVLVLYAGAGKSNQAVGLLVRKDVGPDTKITNTSIDSIGG